MKTLLTLNSNMAGEIESKMLYGTLEELKEQLVPYAMKVQALDEYHRKNDLTATHFLELENRYTSKKDFIQLYNFMEDL